MTVVILGVYPGGNTMLSGLMMAYFCIHSAWHWSTVESLSYRLLDWMIVIQHRSQNPYSQSAFSYGFLKLSVQYEYTLLDGLGEYIHDKYGLSSLEAIVASLHSFIHLNYIYLCKWSIS